MALLRPVADPSAKRTLFEILDSFIKGEAEIERTGEPPKLSEHDMIDLRAKTDGYQKRIFDLLREAATWNGDIEFLEKELKRQKARRQTLVNEAGRIESGMVRAAQFFGFEKLPGNKYSAKLVRASNPKAPVMHRDVTPADMKKFPGLVEQIPRSYEWDASEIKEALKAVAKKQAIIAERNAAGEDLEDGEALTPLEESLIEVAHLEYTYSVEFEPRESQ